MTTRRLLTSMFVAFVALAGHPAHAQTSCEGARGNASALLQQHDSAVYMDTLLLKVIEAEICTAWRRFPELRRIQLGANANELHLMPLLMTREQRAVIDRTVLQQVTPPLDPRTWTPVGRTGLAPLDSLNQLFGANRVEAGWLMDRPAFLRVFFARPVHVGRLRDIYEAAGIPGLDGSGLGFKDSYSRLAWSRKGRFDYLRFQYDSECMDACRKSERYVVRFDRTSGAVRMVERRP